MAEEINADQIQQKNSASDDADQKVAQQNTPQEQPPQKGRWAGRIYALLGLTFFLLIGLTFGAFIRFAEDVAALRPPSDQTQYDAIVVLTGGSNRITQAVRLLEKEVAKKLFISGVNPNISDREIQRVSSASKELFDCCIEVGREAENTPGNGKEITQWAQAKEFKTLAVVTSNYHMLRSLHELRTFDNSLEYAPFPSDTIDMTDFKWAKDPESLRALIREFVKLNAAHFRNL